MAHPQKMHFERLGAKCQLKNKCLKNWQKVSISFFKKWKVFLRFGSIKHFHSTSESVFHQSAVVLTTTHNKKHIVSHHKTLWAQEHTDIKQKLMLQETELILAAFLNNCCSSTFLFVLNAVHSPLNWLHNSVMHYDLHFKKHCLWQDFFDINFNSEIVFI